MKAYSKFLLFFAAIMLSFTSVSVSAVTNAPTGDEATLKWAARVGLGWQKPAGVPIFAEDNIVILSGDEICIVNPRNGEIINRAQMATGQSYGYAAPAYGDNKIFASLSNGTVQAFNLSTLEPCWIYTDPLGGQGLTSVTYSDKMVFTGFWNGETKDASFVCLDSETGELKWSQTIDGGLYWAKPYCTDNAVIFATDDGSDKIAHIYSCNKFTGEITSCIDVENKGDIRSGASFDPSSGKVYFTTKGGYLISAALADGVLSNVEYGEIGASSTSTPVIFMGRIYIGTSDKSISVFNAETLAKIFSVPVKGYPQCTPLLSAAHMESEGCIYLYTTYNAAPGGITLVKIKPDAQSAEECTVVELYDAAGYEQFCISDIIADECGTLYYKNDSGYLFALKSASALVTASVIENGFILPPTELKVKESLAESYGYTDTVEGSVSALDVLVKVHEDMFGADFTAETANDYLSVSEEGWLSRIMGIDTYNFGFAVNGKAPHDDVLTSYGYTGYSLNRAAVKNRDKVEFFLYRDSYAMDNYVHFENDGNKTDYIAIGSGKELSLMLKGYTFAWYSCYDEAQIESMTTSIANADIILIDPKTYETKKLGSTDDTGSVTLSFDKVGKYIISACEREDDYPLIAPWLVIDVQGIDVEIDKNSIKITSNIENATEAVIVAAGYNNRILTAAKLSRVTLQSGISEINIDASSITGDVRVFIWNKNFAPLTEMK